MDAVHTSLLAATPPYTVGAPIQALSGFAPCAVPGRRAPGPGHAADPRRDPRAAPGALRLARRGHRLLHADPALHAVVRGGAQTPDRGGVGAPPVGRRGRVRRVPGVLRTVH